MRQAFRLAKARGAAAVLLVQQADPGFDLPETAVNERDLPEFDGYTAFLGALVEETTFFPGPGRPGGPALRRAGHSGRPSGWDTNGTPATP